MCAMESLGATKSCLHSSSNIKGHLEEFLYDMAASCRYGRAGAFFFLAGRVPSTGRQLLLRIIRTGFSGEAAMYMSFGSSSASRDSGNPSSMSLSLCLSLSLSLSLSVYHAGRSGNTFHLTVLSIGFVDLANPHPEPPFVMRNALDGVAHCGGEVCGRAGPSDIFGMVGNCVIVDCSGLSPLHATHAGM